MISLQFLILIGLKNEKSKIRASILIKIDINNLNFFKTLLFVFRLLFENGPLKIVCLFPFPFVFIAYH